MSSIEGNDTKLIRLGVNDNYPSGGEYNHLINLLNLDAKSLYKQFIKILNI